MANVEQVPTQVANLAISHCGVSKPLASLDKEKSTEGVMCRTFYDLARQLTLRDHPWFFAVKQISPALVANTPTPEWMYAYQYPSDALRVLRFMSWRLKTDTRQSRVSYTVAKPAPANLSQATPQPASTPTTGLWIYTDWPGINTSMPTVLEYIFDNNNVSEWTADFILAMSFKLADLIVATLTTGDPYQYQQKIQAQYLGIIDKAKAANINEEQRPEEPESEFIRARGGEVVGYPGMQYISEPAGFVVL